MANRFLNNIRINDEYTLPATDGTENQIIVTDGAGNLSFNDLGTVTGAITGVESNLTYYEVKNSSGAQILKGKGVMAVGTDGNSGHILIDEMVADGSVEARYFLGVLSENLDNGSIGRVIAFGELDQFNTTGQNGETWTGGQVLWCDPDSAGDFTTTEPDGPNVKIPAAFILKASTNGKIQIRVQANEGIHQLHDTKITTQADGELLVWNNTLGVWQNDGTATIDYTNGRVGIGTTIPSAKLHIKNDDGGSTETTDKILVTGGNGGNNSIMKVEYTQDAGVLTLGYAGLSGDSVVLNGGQSNAGSIISLKENGLTKIFLHSGGPSGTTHSYFNGGNVGIGTTSPGHKLDVRGSGYFLGDTSVPNAPADLGFYLGKSQTDENRRLEIVSPANGVSYIDFTKPNVDYRGRIAYYDNGDSFRFYTAASERIRITSTGNVGIGTTTPGAKLEVVGNIKLSETAATTDTNKFAVLDSGVIKYRTGDQIISDLPTDSRYVAVTGDTMTGALTLDNAGLNVDGLISLTSTNTITTGNHIYRNANNPYYSNKRLRTYYERVISQISADPADYNTYYEIGYFNFTSLEGIIDVEILFNGSGFGQGSRHRIPVSYNMDYLSRYSLKGISTYTNVWLVADSTFQSPRHVLNNESNWELQFKVTGNTIYFRIVIKGSNSQSLNATAYIKFLHSNDFDNVTYNITTGTGTDSTTYDRLPSIISGINGKTLNQNTLIAGQVGIGTASPTSELEVNGGESASAVAFSGATVKIGGYTGIGTTRIFSNGSYIGYSTANSYHDFSNAGASQMRITNTGNVGIGTTSPTQKLHVVGNSLTSGIVETNSDFRVSDSGSVKVLLDDNGTEGRLRLYNGSNWGLIARGVTNSPVVGSYYNGSLRISGFESSDGATLSTYALATFNFGGSGGANGHLQLNGRLYIGLDNDIEIGYSNYSGNGLKWQGSGKMSAAILPVDEQNYTRMGLGFFTGDSTTTPADATERMRITRDGKVGIGTTSPGYTLQVGGAAKFASPVHVGSVTNAVVSASGVLNLSNFKMTINSSTGLVRMPSYGSGTFTGTATQRLAVDSSGNVIEIPIGSGPVDGSGTANYVTKWSDADTITNSAIYDNGGIVSIGSTQQGWSGNQLNVGSTSNAASGLNILTSTTGNAYIIFSDVVDGTATEYDNQIRFNHTDNFLAIQTVGSERLRIDSSGNVGIGTTNPDHTLRVDGDSRIGNLHIKTSDFGSGGTGKSIYADAAGSGFLGFISTTGFKYSNGSSELLRITSTGNVGIGETVPNQKLTVVDSDDSLYDVLGVYNEGFVGTAALGKGAAIRIGNNPNGNYSTKIATVYEGQNPSYLQPAIAFYTMFNTYLKDSETEKMRISASGNVGIGTTSPLDKLDVHGDLRVSYDASNHFIIEPISNGNVFFKPSGGSIHVARASVDNKLFLYDYLDTTASYGTYSANLIDLQYNGVVTTKINTNGSSYFNGGNVGIGTTSPGQKLEVNGNIKMTETAATTDTDKIVVSDSGVLKYRTGAQILSDIGGQASISAPNAPTNLSLTVVGNTIDVTFTASTTSDIDAYLIYSSVDGSDYGLISIIPPDDFSATMSVIDDAFSVSGTQAYRVYAMKLGNMSSALTGSISYTVSTPLEPTNMSVVPLNTAYFVQWDPPSSNARFVTAYNVYKHEAASQASLARASATLVYSGMNTSYMYQVSGSNNTNYHQFWVETTVA